MKKLLKIFTYIILIVLALIIVLTITAKLSENKITDIVLRKVSENIEAPVSIGEVSFNLLRKFPLATIELENVMLGSHGGATADLPLSELDTIVSLQKIYVSVKSRPLINGIFEIVKVELDGVKMDYTVDTSGATNIDFLLTTSEPSEPDTLPSKPLNLTLKDLSLKNIICNYKDSALKVAAKVFIPELKVKAKINGENIWASAKGELNFTECGFEETNLYLMNKTDIDFDIDYENDSVSIEQLLVNTDGAKLGVSGNVVLGDEIETDVLVQGSEIILGELVKYAPREMLKELGLQKVAGTLNVAAKVKGTYNESDLPQVNLDVNFKNGSIVTKDYPGLKNISFQGKITNGILRNNKSTQADFNSFHFETEQSKFDLAFSVLDIDHPKYDIKTDVEINVGEFRKFIPDTLIQYVEGKIKANLSTKGELPDSIGDDFVDYLMANSRAGIELTDFNLDMDTSLSIRDFSGELTYKPNNFKLNNLNISLPAYNVRLKNTSLNADFKGSINNISGMSVNLKSYHIETENSEFSGKAKIKNFDHPSYRLVSNIKLDLAEVKTMLPDTLLDNLDGNLSIDIESFGTLNLDSVADQAMDIVFENSSFNVKFDNVSAAMPDEPLYKLQNFSGQIKMNPGLINIDKMEGFAGGLINFEIDSTTVENLYHTFITNNPDEQIIVQTNIKLDRISNELLGFFMPEDSVDIEQNMGEGEKGIADNFVNESTSPEEMEYLLPDFKEMGLPYFLIRGKLSVDNIEYGKNIIDDLSLKFRFADSIYVIENLNFKTCGGELNTSAFLDARSWDKPKVDIRNHITNLDVRELLYVNDNFGDTSITYDKVRGVLTSELHVRAFYADNDFPRERMRAKGHFTLKEGRIYDYEPLVELSKIRVIGGLKDLDKLDFNTLKISLFMYKNKIYIPKTDVVTSSMDFSAFAMHSFNGDYEYHIKVHLGDILTGKNEKLMRDQAKEYEKDGQIPERNGLKLVSMDVDGNKKQGIDKSALERNFKNQLNKQQGFLNLLFQPNLVNFSTDLDRTKRNREIIDGHKQK